MNNDDEYSDPIDNFKKPLNSQFSQMHPQQAMQQQTMPQQVIQKPNMNPQQQAMQQQTMQQQAMQQQAMQQQAMQQQAMQQQAMHFMKQQQEMQQKNSKSFLEKFGNIKKNFNSSNFSLYLQEILILSVLFIFYNRIF